MPSDYDSLVKYVREEMDVFEAQRPLEYKYKRMAIRFFIRSVRIFFGFILALITLSFLDKMMTSMDVPFSALSPMGLIKILSLGVLVWYFAKWSWKSAFGEGPSLKEIETKRTNEADIKLREIYPQYKKNIGMSSTPEK